MLHTPVASSHSTLVSSFSTRCRLRDRQHVSRAHLRGSAHLKARISADLSLSPMPWERTNPLSFYSFIQFRERCWGWRQLERVDSYEADYHRIYEIRAGGYRNLNLRSKKQIKDMVEQQQNPQNLDWKVKLGKSSRKLNKTMT